MLECLLVLNPGTYCRIVALATSLRVVYPTESEKKGFLSCSLTVFLRYFYLCCTFLLYYINNTCSSRIHLDDGIDPGAKSSSITGQKKNPSVSLLNTLSLTLHKGSLVFEYCLTTTISYNVKRGEKSPDALHIISSVSPSEGLWRGSSSIH